MAYVFISYSSKHRDVTRQLAAYLESKNLTVWWDDALQARGPFDRQIHSALRAAGAVVVVWTSGAIVSDWVKLEAQFAFEHNKLINVLPEDIEQQHVPEPFRDHHRHRPLDHEKILSDVLAVIATQQLLDTKQLTPPADLSSTPSMLLQAKYGVVEFMDIHGLKARLIAWAQGRGEEGARNRPVAGRLVHGAGGLGKTRLMIEVAAALRNAGWSAGFLNVDAMSKHGSALAQLVEYANDKGLLLILDYAEGRTKDVALLCKLMTDAAQADPQRPRRVVLLTREIGEWWDNARRDEPQIAIVFAAPLGRLPEIAIREDVSPGTRSALFDAACAAYAKALAVTMETNTAPPSSGQIARIASKPDYERPLAILMEALLHTYAKALAGDEIGTAALLDQILDLEFAHWAKVLPGLTGCQRREMARGTTQVALVGSTSTRAETAALLMEDPYYRRSAPADVESTVAALAKFYGNGRGGLGQLEPDLIGEHVVLSEAAMDLTHAQQLVAACLSWDGGEKARRTSVLTVLNRGTKQEHGVKAKLAQTLLCEVIHRYAVDIAPALVDVALAEPDGLLPEAIAAAVPRLNEAALEAIDEVLPHATVRLMDAALVVAERRYHIAHELLVASGAANPPKSEARISLLGRLARHRGDLGWRLSNLGRCEDALTATKEAVDIYRALSKDAPATFLRNLATALHNLGGHLSDLGRHEEALAAAKEAVDIRRALAKDRPDAFLPDLASSLNSLGVRLSNLGRREAALSASEEAIEINRALAKDRPDAFLPNLASSLNSLGNRLSDLGRREEALAASSEAVDIRRALAKDRPDAFLPDLASSLNSLGNRLSDLGRREEALAASEETIEINRALAKDRPDAFLPNLASSLNSLGNQLSDLGRREEALAASNEAVDIRRALAKNRPAVFLPNLARSLNNLGNRLSDLGRREEALAAAKEAVDVYRALAKDRPNAFLPDLAACLNNLGTRLSNLGRLEEALAVSEEAIEIRRTLAKDRPDAFLPGFATSMSVMSIVLAAMERHCEAAEAAQAALRTLLPFVERYPERYCGLAGTIGANVSRYSRIAGREPDGALLQRLAKVLDAGDEQVTDDDHVLRP